MFGMVEDNEVSFGHVEFEIPVDMFSLQLDMQVRKLRERSE